MLDDTISQEALALRMIIAAWDRAEYSKITSIEDIERRVKYWLDQAAQSVHAQYCTECRCFGKCEDWCDHT
jgi:hypothetical protein